MVRNKGVGIIALLVFCASALHAQVNRYIVYFPDKAETTYSINAPLEYLSQRAIDRRAKVGFSITEEDFPVNKNYVDSLIKYNAKPYYTSRWFNAAVVEVDQSIIDEISNKSFVLATELAAPGGQYASVSSEFNTSYTPNPPSSSTLSTDTQVEMLAADAMHDDGFTGAGKWIAVFDAGFAGVNRSSAFEHLFQNDMIKDTEDFLTKGEDVFLHDDHGTRVLSCITAKYNEQIVGTGYGAEISLYVTESTFSANDEYRIEEFNWALASEMADSSGVDIISASLGYNVFTDPSMSYTKAELDGQTAMVTRAANMAAERGILVVNSAGNTGGSVWNLITFPSDSENVLAVGGVTGSRVHSSFSGFGPTADNRIKPDVVAMATAAVVINQAGDITQSNGTSFSCPLTAGFAASLWQAKPELTSFELKELIISSSSQSNNPDNTLGFGIPNYHSAVSDILSAPQNVQNDLVVYPNPLNGDILNIKFDNESFVSSIAFNLYNSNGQLVVSEDRLILGSTIEEELELSGLEKGLYILSINGLNNHKAIKLQKN